MDENKEVFTKLLSITRDQLQKSMNLNAELEALLMVERDKVAELEKALAEKEEKGDKK